VGLFLRKKERDGEGMIKSNKSTEPNKSIESNKPTKSEMTEHELQNRIRIALSKHGLVFRINSGKFYQGQKIFIKGIGTVLKNPRIVMGAPAGFSDLLFVGQDKVVFIEVKTPNGITSPEQTKFIKIMKSKGIPAGIVRSEEEAIDLIK